MVELIISPVLTHLLRPLLDLFPAQNIEGCGMVGPHAVNGIAELVAYLFSMLERIIHSLLLQQDSGTNVFIIAVAPGEVALGS